MPLRAKFNRVSPGKRGFLHFSFFPDACVRVGDGEEQLPSRLARERAYVQCSAHIDRCRPCRMGMGNSIIGFFAHELNFSNRLIRRSRAGAVKEME